MAQETLCVVKGIHSCLKFVQLQREVSISGNEVKLLENEQSRLRDENAELRREVVRLDRIIYGKSQKAQAHTNRGRR